MLSVGVYEENLALAAYVTSLVRCLLWPAALESHRVPITAWERKVPSCKGLRFHPPPGRISGPPRVPTAGLVTAAQGLDSNPQAFFPERRGAVVLQLLCIPGLIPRFLGSFLSRKELRLLGEAAGSGSEERKEVPGLGHVLVWEARVLLQRLTEAQSPSQSSCGHGSSFQAHPVSQEA